MNDLDSELAGRFRALSEQGLRRELRRVDSPQSPQIQIDGRALLNFSSNDYLGLANDERIKAAAIEAVKRFGAGAGASRLICGSLSPHHELEETLAQFKGTEAALSFATGYAAALGTIGALVGKDDIVVVDRLAHACLVDAARLSGARLRVFRHNDLNDLERILKWADSRSGAAGTSSRKGRVFVVTESVFSMDGDRAPLEAIVDLKEKYGAWLMVDEAHATGLYGTNGRGLADEQGASADVEVQMGTLGKALGASGGYICGSKVLIDYLVNKARTFIFSTAPVPAAAAAATAAVRLVASEAGGELREKLWKRCAQFVSGAWTFQSAATPSCASSLVLQPAAEVRQAIIPLMIGDEQTALQMAAALRERGIFLPAIRYPTVGRGTARLRLTITAGHDPHDIDQLLLALADLGSAFPSYAFAR